MVNKATPGATAGQGQADMTQRLGSYVQGQWQAAGEDAVELRHAANGEVVALASSSGLDFQALADYARRTGGAALRRYTFHQRAMMLKRLAMYLDERKEDYYRLSFATGATRRDAWGDIDGGITTLFVFASKGRRELPNNTVYIDGAPERISRHGSFVGQHICVPRHGVALHINAYNFPVWGMLEKLAPTILAGMPAIVKPATSTAFLTERVFRDIIASGLLPEGAVQLICGSTGNLLEHLMSQDVIAFTGSAATAHKLQQHPRVIDQAVRFTAETDSLNCSVLGPDATPGSPEFDLYVKEVVREMTAKAGQKCTAIRRAIVPEALLADVIGALQEKLARVRVGDPAAEDTTMGALASLAQREEVRACTGRLAAAGRIVHGDIDGAGLAGVDAGRGAFLPPILIECTDAGAGSPVHSVEAFGPVSTVIPYRDIDHAIGITALGEGSLAGSIFTHDNEVARALVHGMAPWHGRLCLVNRDCAKESTGHGVPLPHLVHGGPGRAGGGEEMGGVRGVMHYMQRTALQGAPTQLTRATDYWLPNAATSETRGHPFRLHFEDLQIGDSVRPPGRTITLEDIEHFAAFTGDTFYAHMDEAAASANPFFEGRVAHGYFIVSAAAGMFVHPDPGPVLANYGLDNLRFMAPAYPGDTLRVRLTCKQKNAREDADYGEVRWDTEVTNQNDEVVASYDVLTLVAKRPA